MNSENSITSKIITYLPIATVVVTVFGAVRLSFYYLFFFDVNIFVFLELNEIVLQTIIGFILVLPMAIFYYLGTFTVDQRKVDASLILFCREKMYLKGLKKLRSAFNIHIVAAIFIILAIAIKIIFKVENSPEIFGLTMAVVFSTTFINSFLIFVKGYFTIYKKLPSIEYRTTFVISFNVILVGILYAVFSMALLKGNKGHLKTTAIIDNKQIIVSDTYYYIGNTQKFVFFYNEKEKTTDVFQMSNVQKLTLDASK